MNMRKVIPLALQRAREADDSRMAGEVRRADIINERLKKHRPAINALMKEAAKSDESDEIVRLYRRAYDLVGEAAKNSVACKEGCSSCCYQPVMISQAEALLIAHEIGREPADVDFTTQRVDAYIGKPCNFLNEKSGKCRIYASRPLVCRGHYSVAIDDVPCYIHPGHPMKVPYLNTQEIGKNFLRALTLEHAPNQADIRDWFPKDKK